MKVGITGHQKRSEIDWRWVEAVLDLQFDLRPEITEAFSSLAAGSDQIFANVARRRHVSLVAIIPSKHYETTFGSSGLVDFEDLLADSKVIHLAFESPSEEAFLAAGRYIVDNVDLLFAVWDAEPAKGKGGTADIVSYALDNDRPLVHINPLTRSCSQRLL